MSPAHVHVHPLPPDRFRGLLGDGWDEVVAAMADARVLFEGRAVWHLNSTARGGGVAELLQSLLGYARGAGIDVRWAVISGTPDFFRLTKRIHNRLHGNPGDGGELGAAERDAYLGVLESEADALAALIRPGDVVFCHDPQTAGLVEPLQKAGAVVLWRCHVGVDEPNDLARSAWDFLRPFVSAAERLVFSRPAYVWDALPHDRVAVVPPSIDAFSAKNEQLDPPTVRAILDRIGLCANGSAPAIFTRHDGTAGRVDRQASIVQDDLLPAGAPLLTQVSRWDRLKDPVGVLEGFAAHVHAPGAHLALVGPSVEGVDDDPEGAEVLAEVIAARSDLPRGARGRVHLLSLPMNDIEENAVMVNAVQRRSTVVAQKSLAEGFGLTATEAMWKGRPVIAGHVGGLSDQVVDGVTGYLIDDPRDLEAFGAAAQTLLRDIDLADRMGAAGRARVRERFLGTRHLLDYVRLLGETIAGT